MDIMNYIDLDGNEHNFTGFQDKLLQFLYGHTFTRILLKPLVSPAVSQLGGWLLNTRLSALLIPGFIRSHQIDMSQYQQEQLTAYPSYNAFFTRQIRPECRPVDSNEEVSRVFGFDCGTAFTPDRILSSPCDGKISVYPIDQQQHFQIKHTDYTLSQLLDNPELASRFQGGYAVVIRLTVDDYHHYCYPASGVKSPQRRIEGVFHTVNPAANDVYPIYKMNTREYCLLKTDKLGTILQMEVGALMVGRIHNLETQSGTVSQAQEKGYFEFGGSTVILLLQKDQVQIRPDLLHNTRKGFETFIRMGHCIGVSMR